MDGLKAVPFKAAVMDGRHRLKKGSLFSEGVKGTGP